MHLTSDEQAETNTRPMCTYKHTNGNDKQAAKVQTCGLAPKALPDQPGFGHVLRHRIRSSHAIPDRLPSWSKPLDPLKRKQVPPVRIRGDEVCPRLHNVSDTLAQRQ